MLPLLPGQQSGLKKVTKGIIEGGWVISITGPNLRTLLISGAGPDPYFRNRSVHIGRWAGGGSSRISRVPQRRLVSTFWCLGGGKGGRGTRIESQEQRHAQFKRSLPFLDCPFGLVFKQEGSAKQPLPYRWRVLVPIRAVAEVNLRGEPHTDSYPGIKGWTSLCASLGSLHILET